MKWNLSKINQYIDNEIEESIHLDYKSNESLEKSDRKKIELSKDISSFANSDGGIIIFGISEYNSDEKKNIPEKVTPIDRLSFPKEWLEQVINSNISPRIQNIKIYPINTDKIQQNTVIYVVDIPKSNTVHQAKDKKYYKRFNFQSIAMEDYEIKDILNRSLKTEIRISFKPIMDWKFINSVIKSKDFIEIQTEVWAHNYGNKVAEFLQVFISGDENASELIYEPYQDDSEEFQMLFQNTKRREIFINGEKQVIAEERMPILPKTSLNLGKFHFNSKLIFDEHALFMQISTEDNNKHSILSGIEILKNKHTLTPLNK